MMADDLSFDDITRLEMLEDQVRKHDQQLQFIMERLQSLESLPMQLQAFKLDMIKARDCFRADIQASFKQIYDWLHQCYYLEAPDEGTMTETSLVAATHGIVSDSAKEGLESKLSVDNKIVKPNKARILPLPTIRDSSKSMPTPNGSINGSPNCARQGLSMELPALIKSEGLPPAPKGRWVLNQQSMEGFFVTIVAMRFKKGSRVEVLSKRDVPSGSWRVAEIINGNGHTYTVRYDGYLGRDDETALDRVSRKAVRPCPPVTGVVDNWVLGDVVEVFDDFSWKMATVTKVLDRKHFLVRLLGSSLEFRVGTFDIRPRQSWEDARWVVIRKGSGSFGDRKHYTSTLKNNREPKFHVQRTSSRRHANVQADCFSVRNMETCQESAVVSRKTLKRGAYGNLQLEAYDGSAKNFRAIEKEGDLCQEIAANHFSSPDQVDAAAFSREIVREKIIYASFDNRTGFPEMYTESRKLAGAVGCSSAINVDSLDYDIVTSSVGSCSITNNLSKLCGHTSFIEDVDVCTSDAESSTVWGSEGNSILPKKEDLAGKIHRLELHAYRCTMGALYASGPLCWEQEALVTNLRLFLHISNDEHLMEATLEPLKCNLPKVEHQNMVAAMS